MVVLAYSRNFFILVSPNGLIVHQAGGQWTPIAHLPAGTLCSASIFVSTGYPADGPDL